MMVSDSTFVSNNNGINASGSGATVRIGNSRIMGSLVNGVTSSAGATLLSYKNNQIDGNVNNGTPIPQVALN